MGKYFNCECGTEVINIERDIEVFDKEKKIYDVSIYFAMYFYGSQDHRVTLRNRLRHCWQILRTGKNYADNVILSKENAERMGKYLITLVDKEDIEKEVNN